MPCFFFPSLSCAVTLSFCSVLSSSHFLLYNDFSPSSFFSAVTLFYVEMPRSLASAVIFFLYSAVSREQCQFISNFPLPFPSSLCRLQFQERERNTSIYLNSLSFLTSSFLLPLFQGKNRMSQTCICRDSVLCAGNRISREYQDASVTKRGSRSCVYLSFFPPYGVNRFGIPGCVTKRTSGVGCKW